MLIPRNDFGLLICANVAPFRSMKVLMVTPYLLYPPFSGGQTRSFNLIKHLASSCEITLFSFVLPDQDPGQVRHLRRFCRRIFTIERGKTWTPRKIIFTGFSPYSFLMTNYLSPRLKKLIAEELKRDNYDLIHVECFYLMPNIPAATVPVILVDQTIEFAVYQHFVETLPKKFTLLKPFLWLDVAKLKYWETRFWKRADTLIAVSGDDQKLMEKLSSRRVEVVPNGVDDSLLKQKKIAKYRQPTVLYGVANFKWMQNKEGAVNLLKFVWPKIKKAIPQAKLYVAGRHSIPFLQKIKETVPFAASVKAGEVKDAGKIYRKSWVLVAPMRSGGGSRTKFFEAMACGLPIVTTPQGIEGIEARNNYHVMVADDFDRLAQITIRLLQDKKKREEIGRHGRALVKERYSWQVSAAKLLRIYRRIAHEK